MKTEVIEFLTKYQNDICFALDSGAFTAWKAGKSINLEDYCKFIENLPFKPHMYFVLDVIGDPEKTKRNYYTMLDRGLKPIPIFTRGDNPMMIDEYYKTSDIIGIGGLVGTPRNKGFVKGIMKIIAGRKCHWLGFTNKDFVYHYCPYSCDSSSVMMTARFGLLELFDSETFKWVKVMKKQHAKILSLERVISSYSLSALEISNSKIWKGRGKTTQLSFKSHVRGSIQYEQKLKTKYFIAPTAGTGDLNTIYSAFLVERILHESSSSILRRNGFRDSNCLGVIPT